MGCPITSIIVSKVGPTSLVQAKVITSMIYKFILKYYNFSQNTYLSYSL